METIIRKAIEGGYNGADDQNAKDYGTHCLCICDPLFWQALGKSCGWGATERFDWETGEPYLLAYWKHISMCFHEINLTEGWDKAIEYLEKLVL